MTKMALPLVSLDDCVDLLAGFAFKSQYFTEKGEDIPLVKGENVSQGHILWGISRRWPVSEWESLAKYQLRAGDVVVAMDRPWVPAGLKWAYIRGDHPKSLLVQRCARLRSKSPKLDQDFLRFVIGGQGFESYVKPITTGVNIPHISGKQILDYKFPLPPLPVQKRIAGILSAYDELIENSQRRIKILEAMARGLYREWFVHFRFPGHKNHPRVASALGEIPQGWEVKKLGDISCCINRGITPIYDEEGDSFVINQKCVRDQRLTLEPARKQSKAVSNEKRVCFGDVLVNSTGVGTLGRVAQVYENLENYTVDTHITIARAKRDIDLDFYGCCLLSLQETFERMGVGATGQTELGRAAISDIDLAIPPIILQQQFGKSVHGIRSAAETYAKKIQNLRRTRDLLLPRLLSGQIEVKVA